MWDSVPSPETRLRSPGCGHLSATLAGRVGGLGMDSGSSAWDGAGASPGAEITLSPEELATAAQRAEGLGGGS